MNIKPLLVLKNLVLFTSVFYTVVLLTVCLMSSSNLPDVDIAFGDKIFHFLAYCIFTFLWFYTFILKYKWPIKKAIIITFLAAVLYGIIIEILQGNLTVSRSFDYYDALANSIGALFGSLILMVKNRRHLKKI